MWSYGRVKSFPIWLLLAAVGLTPNTTVHGGPPLVTDDPETPGRRGWEVNLSHNIESTRHEFVMESPLIDINYGPQNNDQLKIEFAVLSIDPTDDRNHWGVSDLLFGYKYRFLEEDDIGWMTSFYPQVSAPTGNRHVGLGSGNVELLTPFQLGTHFWDDRLFVYAEAGYNVVLANSGANHWKFGLAGEWKVTERFELLGEVGSFVFPRNAEPDDPFFNLGVSYGLSEHVAFIGSAGRSFRDRREGTPDFMSFIGLQITWGRSADAERSTD
jgi:hypothetical protein